MSREIILHSTAKMGPKYPIVTMNISMAEDYTLRALMYL